MSFTSDCTQHETRTVLSTCCPQFLRDVLFEIDGSRSTSTPQYRRRSPQASRTSATLISSVCSATQYCLRDALHNAEGSSEPRMCRARIVRRSDPASHRVDSEDASSRPRRARRTDLPALHQPKVLRECAGRANTPTAGSAPQNPTPTGALILTSPRPRTAPSE